MHELKNEYIGYFIEQYHVCLFISILFSYSTQNIDNKVSLF